MTKEGGLSALELNLKEIDQLVRVEANIDSISGYWSAVHPTP